MRRPDNTDIHRHRSLYFSVHRLVERGKYVPEEVVSKLEKKENLSKKERQVLENWKALQLDRAQKIQWLKSERRWASIEIELRQCLHPQAPDLQRCIQILDEMNHLQLSPLMFKKQPQVLYTMQKLCHYVGPRGQGSDIEDNVKIVRGKCQNMYSKIQSCFSTPTSISFKEFFKQEVEGFKVKCQNLSTEQVAVLTCENNT